MKGGVKVEPNGAARIEDCEEWSGGDSRNETTNCEQSEGAEMDVSPAEATNTNVGGQGPPMQTCDWEQGWVQSLWASKAHPELGQ